jgi:hypothetical protein
VQQEMPIKRLKWYETGNYVFKKNSKQVAFSYLLIVPTFLIEYMTIPYHLAFNMVDLPRNYLLETILDLICVIDFIFYFFTELEIKTRQSKKKNQLERYERNNKKIAIAYLKG